MQTQTISAQPISKKTIQKRQMHLYVFICVGVFLTFVVTFPLAYLRVSNSEKYEGIPFKSLT